MNHLAERVLSGDVAAVARACRWVEEGVAGSRELVQELFRKSGKAHVIGITGSPGVGKSTLVDALIGAFRARGASVGVVATDPTSPFSGGALLGDRIRMQRHALDPAVFIRSLATRGAQGGLSRACEDVVTVLDAWGADPVLVETAGVGQTELGILGVASTVVLVTTPNLGDEVQASKAGLWEAADLMVLNKADQPGAETAAGHVRSLLERDPEDEQEGFRRRLVRTVAPRGEGVTALIEALDAHRTFLGTERGQALRLSRVELRLAQRVRELAHETLLQDFGSLLLRTAERVTRRELDPEAASRELLDALLPVPGPTP